jgi:hypothetical protein
MADSRLYRNPVCWWLVLPVCLPFLFPAARAGTDPVLEGPAGWIAADAVAYFELPRPGLLIDRLGDPRLQGYLKVVPPSRDFLDSPNFGQARAVVNLIASRLDTTWDRGLRDLTGGGIAAAVEADAGKAPRIYLLITPKDAGLLERAIRVVRELARDDAVAKGKPDPVTTTEHRGVMLHASGGAEGGAYAVIKGRLVLSNSGENLKRLIDRTALRPAGDGTGSPTASRDALVDQPDWKRQRDRLSAESLAWGFVRLDRLRQVDPKRFASQEKGDTGVVLLFGSWYEAIKRASWIAAGVQWTDAEIGATLDLAAPPGGYPPAIKGFVPAAGQGSAPLIAPAGTVASLSLWRDWATIWESRAELFTPEVVQGLAQLDTFAGQFFGGREFGSDVLGAFDPHWRLVVAQQDYQALKPPPDVKLPAVALVAELESPDGDFAQRLKVAFQSFVGLANIGAAQQKAPLLELGSEVVEGVTVATTRFMVPRAESPASVQPHPRYNFSPAAAQVGKFFILSSSTQLARTLVKELKSGGGNRDAAGAVKATLTLEADGPELARLLEQNRVRLVMQTMLKQGETKAKAEQRVDLLLSLVRYLGRGRFIVRDDPDATRFGLRIPLLQSSERPRGS